MRKRIKLVYLGITKIFFVFLCIPLSNCIGQKIYTVEIVLENSNSSKVYLSEYHGFNTVSIDSSFIQSNTIHFKISSQHSAGLMNVYIDSLHSYDFIFNYEDVQLQITSDQVIVLNSEENKLYYKYFNCLSLFNQKTDSIQLSLAKASKKEIRNAAQEIARYFDNIPDSCCNIRKSDSSFASSIIHSLHYPRYDFFMLNTSKKKYSKQDFYFNEFLNHIHFKDSRLLNTPYSEHLINQYLNYFYSLNDTVLLKKAAIKLFEKSLSNNEYKDYVSAYLVQGLINVGKNEIAESIALLYLNNSSCFGEQQNENPTKEYLKGIQSMSKGKVAPNIKGVTLNGSAVSDDTIPCQLQVIFFWKPGCPYCKEVEQTISKLIQSRTELTVFAVCIDTSYDAWRSEAIDQTRWYNISDLNGFKGTIAQSFYIQGTPAVYILDKNRIILDKFFGLDTRLERCLIQHTNIKKINSSSLEISKEHL